MSRFSFAGRPSMAQPDPSPPNQPSKSISGYLLKKSGNKFNVAMQKRFVKLEGNYLRYFKSHAVQEEQGSIDLSSASWVKPRNSTPACKTFEIEEKGRTYVFEAGSNREMSVWLDSIDMVRSHLSLPLSGADTVRRTVSKDNTSTSSMPIVGRGSVLGSFNDTSPMPKGTDASRTMFGPLKKKSGSALQVVMQERFVKLEGTFLRYFKTHLTTEESGSINLASATWVKPANNSPQCKVFEVEEGGRVYVFEACDPEELRLWLDSIDLIRGDLALSLSSDEVLKGEHANMLGAMLPSVVGMMGNGSPGAGDMPRDTTASNAMFGPLMKKSGSLGSLQLRFVKLDGNFLRYYKNAGDDTELGCINLTTADWVKPSDTSNKCKAFEIEENERRHVFETSDHAELRIWLESIAMVSTSVTIPSDPRSEPMKRLSVNVLSSMGLRRGSGSGASLLVPRDTAPSRQMQGPLLKKSGQLGTMQERFVKLDGNYIRYFKDHKTLEESGHINLAISEWIKAVDQSPECKSFEVEEDGRIFLFEAAHNAELKLWLGSIDMIRGDLTLPACGEAIPRPSEDGRESVRRQSVLAQAIQRASVASGFGVVMPRDTTPSMTMHGPLMKKSGNSLQTAMQERFVKLDGKYLRYYKNHTVTEESGSIDLSVADWARPADNSAQCKAFEIEFNSRIYFFEAESCKELAIWLDSIDLVRGKLKRSLSTQAIKPPTSIQKMRALSTSGGSANVLGPNTTSVEPPPRPRAVSRIICGTLLKRSGNVLQLTMQERFVKLEGTFLRYFKTHLTTEESGSINLASATWVKPANNSPQCKVFEVEEGGRVYVFEACDPEELRLWLDSIDLILGDLIHEDSTADKPPPKFARRASTRPRLETIPSKSMAGYLQKKSGNLLSSGMQERYVKLDEEFLRYYKSHTDTEESGSIKITSLSGCGPVDLSDAGCKSFNVFTEGRTLTFEAATTAEMTIWLQSLEMVSQPVIDNKIPAKFIVFDEEGEDAFVQLIRDEVVQLYPQGGSGARMTIRQHLECAGLVVGYLIAFKAQSVETRTRSPRFDILVAGVNAINEAFCDSLDPIIDEDNVQFSVASKDEIKELIMLLIGYDETLRKMDEVTRPEVRFHAHSFTALNNMPMLCNFCVNGSASHLSHTCSETLAQLVRAPNEMVVRNKDGSFSTEVPSQMWKEIKKYLDLAQSNQSLGLYFCVARMIAAISKATLNSMAAFADNLGSCTSADTRFFFVRMELLSALANDTIYHCDKLSILTSGLKARKHDLLGKEIVDQFESLTVEWKRCGNDCLRSLAGVVMADSKETLNQIFTLAWVQGNQADVVIATVNDYMTDLDQYLARVWSGIFAHCMVEAVVVGYIHAIIYKVPPKARPEDSPDEIVATKRAWKENQCRINSQTLTRYKKDVKLLKALLTSRVGVEGASRYINILNEVALLFNTSIDDLPVHILRRFAECPSSSIAIFDVCISCVVLRDDVDPDEVEELMMMLRPGLQVAPEAVKQFKADGLAEGAIGNMYDSLFKCTMKAIQQSMRENVIEQ